MSRLLIFCSMVFLVGCSEGNYLDPTFNEVEVKSNGDVVIRAGDIELFLTLDNIQEVSYKRGVYTFTRDNFREIELEGERGAFLHQACLNYWFSQDEVSSEVGAQEGV